MEINPFITTKDDKLFALDLQKSTSTTTRCFGIRI